MTIAKKSQRARRQTQLEVSEQHHRSHLTQCKLQQHILYYIISNRITTLFTRLLSPFVVVDHGRVALHTFHLGGGL